MKTEFNLPALLQASNLFYQADGSLLHYRPGNCPAEPTLFLSATAATITKVANLALPVLVARGCGFRMPASEGAARQLDVSLEEGPGGGVSIQICIPVAVDVPLLCSMLIDLTSQMSGPRLYGYTYLGGLLYASPEISRRYKLRAQRVWRRLTGRIPRGLVIRHVKVDRKGTVARAWWWSGRGLQQVVIKEGRFRVWEDHLGRDMRERIDWQYWLGIRMAGCVNIARPLFVFTRDDNRYLVSELIDGKSMHEVVLEAYNGASWRDFTPAKRGELLIFMLKACLQVLRLHRQGVVHRDLTTSNLVMSRRGDVFLLDLELAYSSFDDHPDPPFGVGTKGFMSPNQLQAAGPVFADDIYALGACLKAILSGLPPGCVADGAGQAGTLVMISGDERLSVLAARCMDRRPRLRPGVAEIVRALEQHIASPVPVGPLSRPVAAIALEAVLQAWLTDEHMGLSDVERGRPGAMPVPDPLQAGSAWLRYHGAEAVLMLLANLKECGGWLGASNNGLALSVHEAATRLQWRSDAGLADPLVVKSAVGLTRSVEAELIDDTAGVRELVTGYFGALPVVMDPDRVVAAGLGLLRSAELAGADMTDKKLVAWADVCQQQLEKMAKRGDPLQCAGIIYFLGYLRAIQPQVLDLQGYERHVGRYTDKLKKTLRPGLVAPGHLRALLRCGIDRAAQLALEWIDFIPSHLVLFNWSLEAGMAGYGRLLLEAGCDYERQDWQKQAGWIAGIIAGTSAPVRQTPGKVQQEAAARAGRLFSDEGGAMFFLSQYLLRQTQNAWREPCLF